jgi:hypothetical protein
VRQEKAKHELGNALGVVLANLEGMIDGIVMPTTERLEALAGAMRRAQALLAELNNEETGER